MKIEKNHKGNIWTMQLIGRFDAQTAPIVEKELLQVLQGEIKMCIVDFEQVDYISSSGLRVLLSFLKESNEKKVACRLAALKPAIQQIFELSGFDSLFTIFDTVDQALEAKP